MTNQHIDPKRAAENYPATAAEARAYYARTAMPAGPRAYLTLREMLSAPRRDSEVNHG